MSLMRQAPPDDHPHGEALVRSYAVTHPSGTVVLPQPAGWDQLVYASRGVMRVSTRAGIWIVPPDRAVWVPADLRHRIDLSGRTSLRSLYFAAGFVPLARDCRAVNVTPLVRELVLHAVATAPLFATDDAHLRLVGVLLDQLATLPDAPLQLPMPSDPRALAVCHALMADASSSRTVESLAADAGASRRSVERLFVRETGMTVGRWRTRQRLIEAIQRLAEGESVTRVSVAVGYATPSAFTAAFRKELGTSPTRYLAP
jgi:AraC-like DNA-binding protein